MTEAQPQTAAAAEHRHVKSFVIRAGRMTQAQSRALTELGPKYLIDVSALKQIEPADYFGRSAPLTVEIGFGMGRSFIEMAAAAPERSFLGIEVHPPGVGSCLMQIESLGLTNVRVIQYDAYEVLRCCLKPESIDVLQVFFPDPWPKARHHKRRLINEEFIGLITLLMKSGGEVRMATDWQEYAEEMLALFTKADGFVNAAPEGGFMPRPEWRPLTKFELRGEKLGHGVWDVVFRRV